MVLNSSDCERSDPWAKLVASGQRSGSARGSKDGRRPGRPILQVGWPRELGQSGLASHATRLPTLGGPLLIQDNLWDRSDEADCSAKSKLPSPKKPRIKANGATLLHSRLTKGQMRIMRGLHSSQNETGKWHRARPSSTNCLLSCEKNKRSGHKVNSNCLVYRAPQ